MSRSLKELYPEKYQNFLNSKNYKLRTKIQQESNFQKEVCKREANYICAHCGEHALDAHHIIPIEEGGEDTQENLICLCRRCHQQVHKDVYTVDKETKTLIPVINKDHIVENKPEYVVQFEELNNLVLYKATRGWYTFINSIKVELTAKEIKEAVNYVPKAHQKHTVYHEVANMKKLILEKSQDMPWKQGKELRRFVRLYNHDRDYEILKQLYTALNK